MIEVIVVGAAVLGFLFYRGTLTMPRIGARVAAARAAATGVLPTAPRRGLPRGVKMLLGIVAVIILIKYSDQIWPHMNGVWAETWPGKALEAKGVGYSNLLWLAFLLPLLYWWKSAKPAASTSTTTATAAKAKPGNPNLFESIPDYLKILIFLVGGALITNWYTSSGNTVVDMTGYKSIHRVLTIDADETVEVHLPGASLTIGGCSVYFYVTKEWEKEHPGLNVSFVRTSSGEHGYFQYATVAEPLQSSLLKNRTAVEVQIYRQCTVGPEEGKP